MGFLRWPLLFLSQNLTYIWIVKMIVLLETEWEWARIGYEGPDCLIFIFPSNLNLYSNNNIIKEYSKSDKAANLFYQNYGLNH